MVSRLSIGAGIGIPFRNIASGGGKPYLPPELKASLRVVAIDYGKTNNDPDRATIKNLVDPDNPLIISNAAFKLNSGHGLYQLDFGSLDRTDQSVLTTDYKSVTISKIIKESDGNVIYNWGKNLPALDSVRIQVKGLDEIGARLVFIYLNDSGQNVRTTYYSDGTYDLPASAAHSGDSYTTNFRLAIFGYTGDCNVTITQIPQYEGAFITDGVDDAIYSTKTMSQMLTDGNALTVVSMMAQVQPNQSLGYGLVNYFRSGGYYRNQNNGIGKTGIFGFSTTNATTTGSATLIDYVMGDKKDFKVNTSGVLSDSIYSVTGWVNPTTKVIWETSSVAWYWTIIANKVLTPDDINLIIAYYNLDRCIEPTVWYDTIRQGLSNNTPDSEWYLKDFSKNGYDMQLFNFAKKGNSGIGKYETDFLDSGIWNYKTNSSVTSDKIVCNKAATHIMLLYYSLKDGNKYDVPSFNVLKEGDEIEYFYINEQGIRKNVKLLDGINTLPASHGTLFTGTEATCGFGNPGIGNSVTIQQIPSHEGALVFDGVEDYGQFVGNLGLKDYTVVMNRAYQSLINSQVPLVSSNLTTHLTPFIMEHWNSTDNNAISFSFGASKVTNVPLDISKKVTYQSTYSYIGDAINKGTDSSMGDGLTLGKYGSGVQYASLVLWNLLLFPYSMNEFLIERQLKKRKGGTLYPDMIELRPIIKGGSIFKYLRVSDNKTLYPGDYINVGDTIRFYVSDISGTPNEVSKFTVNGIEGTPKGDNGDLFDVVVNKSPQKIDITIDEYIRYEDIVQPYPFSIRIYDSETNHIYTWGDKLKIGSKVVFKEWASNLLPELYKGFFHLNQADGSNTAIELNKEYEVFKGFGFTVISLNYIGGTNTPKCILSPSRLRIPNSSYKILGYIPDLSGNGNHGILNNSAYAEGSGVNADGSYQLDGVDDFISIPTTVGGKQVIMKVIWNDVIADAILYDQRGYPNEFAIYNADNDNSGNPVTAYQARNNGETYIDGILNSNIKASELKNVNHIITITNELSSGANNTFPIIGSNRVNDAYFTKMALYDFMLFDDISSDEEILTLNKYIGIEPKVTVPPYYWDAYGKANNNTDDIEGTRHALWNKANMADAGQALTCENFAYDEMSGYGGYSFKSFDTVSRWNVYDNTAVNGVEIVSRNGYSITLRKKASDIYAWQFNYGASIQNLSEDLDFKIKCDKTIKIVWQLKYQVTDGEAYQTETLVSQEVEANTEADISLIHKTAEQLAELGAIKYYYLIYFNNAKLAIDEEYTITMLPLYPNGLCLDGVTDYLSNANIPAFTDYTYVLKRELLDLDKFGGNASMHKGSFVPAGGRAFIADYYINSGVGTDGAYGFSFGSSIKSPTLLTDKTVYGTKTSVNGVSITPGSATDDASLTLGKWDTNYKQMVFYKLMLYPKTLTNLEIMFLKNMFEKDEIIDLTNPIFIQQ